MNSDNLPSSCPRKEPRVYNVRVLELAGPSLFPPFLHSQLMEQQGGLGNDHLIAAKPMIPEPQALPSVKTFLNANRAWHEGFQLQEAMLPCSPWKHSPLDHAGPKWAALVLEEDKEELINTRNLLCRRGVGG